jgi:outer membrane protein OmpA-like peptidoglycan-associated protein
MDASRQLSRVGAISLVASLVVASSGCSSFSRTEKGAVIGGATGAVLGGAIGKAAGSTAKGAIIGAAVGGAAGAVIGRQMDKQAEELEQDLPNATVERVGEGIQVTFDSGILFDFDSDRLRPEARSNLSDLAASLKEYPNSDLLIVGHTDALGSDAYNQELSERRAAAATRYLLAQGVGSSRIESVGLGETEPVADNETDEGRALNRRVEVAIFASEEYRQQLQRG